MTGELPATYSNGMERVDKNKGPVETGPVG
jgi:hypothetical protein